MPQPTFRIIVTERSTGTIKESVTAESKYAAKNRKNALRAKYPENQFILDTFKE